MSSDLVVSLIDAWAKRDDKIFEMAATAIMAEERAKAHMTVVNRINDILSKASKTPRSFINLNASNIKGLLKEVSDLKSLNDLVLERDVIETCNDFIEERKAEALLLEHDIQPRNRMLFVGPPGNGKTSLAGAIAKSLDLPLIVASYDILVGSYLGETGSHLNKIFEFVKKEPCVFFMDEFEFLGSERNNEFGCSEMRRVVASLLLHLDELPNSVIFIGATNHQEMLDKAAWRRFQIHLTLDNPTRDQTIDYLLKFSEKRNISFGSDYRYLAERLVCMSFSDLENFTTSVFRKHVIKKTCL